MFETLKNAWKIPDLRRKILYTVLLIVVFRLGSFIPVPWLNRDVVSEWVNGGSGNTLFNLMDTFSGGALSNATIFAMSITPYINSSIIMQLLCVAIPALERLSKEGEEGRKKISAITRYLTVVLAAVQAIGLYLTLRNTTGESGARAVQTVEGVPTLVVAITIIFAFTAGTAFLMWLGEQITGKGIGNGISMLIFAGIVARVPAMVRTMIANFANKESWYWIVFYIIFAILSVAFVVLVNEAERRIPVQYAKRVVGRRMYGGQNTNIPIKVAMAGVIPIIFAMSIMTFPATIAQLFTPNVTEGVWYNIVQWFSSYSYTYVIVYFLLIVGFTFFYTSITFNPVEVSNNIKNNGGMIPGIRSGKPTSDFIARVLSKTTIIGALFLAIIAVLPILVSVIARQAGAVALQGIQSFALTGTSLLIVVGVALETVRQIQEQMLVRHYKGFLE